MAGTLGTIRGQMILDVKQTLAAYTAARAAHVSTVTALHAGAGALTMLGGAMTAAGVGLGAGLLVAVGAAAEFEKRLDYFGAVSNATQGEYDAIRLKALQLGQDSKYSANEIAESFIELGKSGVSAQGIINGIGEAVTNLGQATDLPLADAATSLTTILNTFGLQAEDAVGVVDKLAGAANSSSIDVGDLITTMTYAGASAKVAGIGFEDVNTAIAMLGERGIKGSKAGTGLRQMFDKLIAPTKGGTSALKELGIITDDGANSLTNMDGTLKPIPALLDTLNGALDGMNAGQKTDILGRIFPITSLPTILNLLDGGSSAMARLNTEINKTTAMDIAGKRMDNLAGDVEILKGNLETLMITAGSNFQEFARGLVQGVTGIIGAFANLPSGVMAGIMIFTAIAAIILIVVGVMGLIAGAVLNIIAMVIQLAPVFAALGKVVGIVSAAFRALGVAMMANPIGLIIGLIALLVGALIWFFTQTELGRTVWANFTQFLGEAWANIVSFATTTFTNLGSFFSDLWTNIVSFFQTAIAFIMNLFFTFHPLGIIIANWNQIIGFFVGLWTTITAGISGFVTGVIAFFVALPAQIVAFFAGLPAALGYILGFVLGTVVRILMEMYTWIVTNIPIMVAAFIAFFVALPGQIGAFFADMYNQAVTWLANMMTQALALAMGIVMGIVGFIQALPGQVQSFFAAMVAGAISLMQNMMAQGISIAGNLVAGIIGFVAGLPGQVGSFFAQVVSNVQNFMGQAASTAQSMAAQMMSNIVSGIAGIPGAVTGIFGRVVSAVRNAISGAINAVRDFAAGMWEGFKDGLGIHSPSYIEHAMWAITGVVDEETKGLRKQVQVLQGLGNGISAVGNNLGKGFGSTMDTELISLKKQLSAASDIQTEFAVGTQGAQAGVGSTQEAALNGIGKTLQSLKKVAGDTKYDIVVNNPIPEKASTSLPTAIRKTAYVS